MEITTIDANIMLIYLLNTKGAMRSCLAGWKDIFNLANRSLQKGGLPPLFHTRIISLSPRQLNFLAQSPAPDIVMAPVMLGDSFSDMSNQPLLELLANWHRQGVTLASACAGSFILGAAGVLDNRSATTHWTLAEKFRRQYPAVLLNEGELLIENPAADGGKPGAILCGGGITAYIDVALAIIATKGGSALAQRVGRVLLWDPHRPRQTVYAEANEILPIHGDENILKAEAWAHSRLNRHFGLPEWALSASLELRSFERRFHQANGTTPGLWLRQQRLKLARELLANSIHSWEEISISCGYRDPNSFRTLFKREFGLNPKEFRARFSQNGL